MYIIILYLLCIAFLRIALPKKNIGKKLYIFFSGGLLLLIASFRSIDFGTDVPGYVKIYNSLSYTSVSDILVNFITGEGKDPVFYLFSKIISLLGASPQLWLTIIALIFCIAVFNLIYKYSPEPFLSIVAFISLGYFFFSLTGLRQTLALAIIIYSYKYLKRRSLLKFVLIVLIAYLFHSSAIIFLLAYPMAQMKIGVKQVVSVSIALLIAIFLKEDFIGFLSYFIENERYDYYLTSGQGLSLTGFLIQLSILLFILLYKNELTEKSNENTLLLNLMFLGLVFQAFSSVIAEFFRISMYFSIFSIILLARTIECEKNKNKKVLIYLTVLFSLCSYTVWTQSFSGFTFFWQE